MQPADFNIHDENRSDWEMSGDFSHDGVGYSWTLYADDENAGPGYQVDDDGVSVYFEVYPENDWDREPLVTQELQPNNPLWKSLRDVDWEGTILPTLGG